MAESTWPKGQEDEGDNCAVLGKGKRKLILEFGREYPSLGLGLGLAPYRSHWAKRQALGSTEHTRHYFLGYTNAAFKCFLSSNLPIQLFVYCRRPTTRRYDCVYTSCHWCTHCSAIPAYIGAVAQPPQSLSNVGLVTAVVGT